MANKLFLLASLMLLAACHEAKPETKNPNDTAGCWNPLREWQSRVIVR